jgi:hypothetical protein
MAITAARFSSVIFLKRCSTIRNQLSLRVDVDQVLRGFADTCLYPIGLQAQFSGNLVLQDRIVEEAIACIRRAELRSKPFADVQRSPALPRRR